MKKKESTLFHRRGFMKSSAVGAGFVIVKPASVFGAPANSTLQMGLIGCGGRGNHDASVFIRNTDTRFVALADYFKDRLNSTKEHLDQRLEAKDHPKIDPTKMYDGFDGYKELLELDDVDMVLITSPVYYHPEHFEAAVDAGKHIYMEKPVASDVVGAKKVMRAGRKAQEKLSVMVGLQIRFSEEFQEIAKRIHRGDIGDPISGMVHYHTGRLSPRHQEGDSETEKRLRNWVFDQELSGDIIVEQNVHVIDVGNWYLQSHPEKAHGTGGRRVRTDVGDCWDHFLCTFWYPDDVKISFSSTQFLQGWSDCRERIFGSKGIADTPYSGHAEITGENAWKSEGTSLLSGSEDRKVRAFVESVKSGQYVNEAQQGAESTLTAILGRIAAYEEKEVTWEEMMKSNQEYDPGLKQ